MIANEADDQEWPSVARRIKREGEGKKNPWSPHLAIPVPPLPWDDDDVDADGAAPLGLVFAVSPKSNDDLMHRQLQPR